MPIGLTYNGVTETSRTTLKSYNVILPMSSLTIGVDNIHHDVFLSPKFVQITRDYLFDLIRQNASSSYLSGMEFRSTKPVDSTAFRKVLTELLQNSLTRAKHQKNIEIDILFRLAILKCITTELHSQFANVMLDAKEYIRKRGEYFERSQQAHVLKARISEMQSARRDVIRLIGQLVAQIVIDIEENVIAKARRALFGEDFTPFYELLKNRLIFLDGGKDDFFFLEHYVLLGNYSRDPDRFEAMDELFQEFLKETGAGAAPEVPESAAAEKYRALTLEADQLRGEIAAFEEERENLRKKLLRGDGLLNKFLSSSDPADLRSAFRNVEKQIASLQTKLEGMAPQLEEARERAECVTKDGQGRLADYLNEPENARRLFDASTGDDSERANRVRLLAQLTSRLEERELLAHIVASYEIRPIANDFCPPVHLQQLRKALVSKEEAGRVEQLLKQVQAKRLSMKPIEELTKRIRRYSRDEAQTMVLKFATDFLRLRRDLHDAEHLTTGMERINLVAAEKVR